MYASRRTTIIRTRVMGVWWGGDGVTSEGVYLKYWKIDRLRAWFRAKVAAAVTTAFGDDLLLTLFGLITREGLSPFFTRSGERRKADILVSVK